MHFFNVYFQASVFLKIMSNNKAAGTLANE